MNDCRCGECQEFETYVARRETALLPVRSEPLLDNGLQRLVSATTLGIVYHPELRGISNAAKGAIQSMLRTHTDSVVRHIANAPA